MNEGLKWGGKTYTLRRVGTTTYFATAEEAVAAYQTMLRGDGVKMYKDFDSGMWKVMRTFGYLVEEP